MTHRTIRFGWALICKNKKCGRRSLYKLATLPPRLEFEDPLADLGNVECSLCHEAHRYEGIDLDEV